MLGLRGKSVLIVLMMVATIITLALGLVNYVAQQISIKLGKEFAIQHSQRYKAEMGVALEHDLRLTQQLAKNHSIIAWMQNEQDTQLKQQVMPILANYLSVINSDSWFVAPQSSQNFYYNNKSNLYADGRVVKKLEADQPLDAWFFHTINSVAPFNLNIDFDPAINETKLWINMPVEHEGRRIGVVGAGFDFATFINRYVSSRQAGFRAMVLSRGGAILAKDGEMRTTFNLHTSPPDSWLTLWHLLDDAEDQKRLEGVFDQVTKANKSAVSFELALEGKTYIAAAVYIPQLEWIAVSLVDESLSISEQSILWISFALIVLVLLIALTVFLLIDRQLLLPIKRLSVVTQRIASGDYAARLDGDKQPHDELGELINSVNLMAEKVDLAHQNSQERYRWLTENMHDVIWVMNEQARFLYVSPSVTRLRGFTPEEVMQQRLEEVVCPSSLPLVIDAFNEGTAAAKRGEQVLPQTLELEQPCKDGSSVWTEAISQVVKSEQGELRIIGVTRDISERRKGEETMRKLAHYDSLTGCVNRYWLNSLLRKAMSEATHTGVLGALLYLDLDNFKPLNDAYGHDAGDAMLVEVAKRLRGVTRTTDTVARMGGDEFVVLLPKLAVDLAESRDRAYQIALKIAAVLSEPYQLTQVEHQASASVGVVLFGADVFLSASDMIRRADSAMYKAKQQQRGSVVVWSQDLSADKD